MTYEQSPERNLIGRRQALCSLAGIATAVAGIGLIGIGTARAGDDAPTPSAEGPTVSADEAIRSSEDERDLAMVRALVPEDLDVGKWSIERVHAPRLGAVAVVMRTPEGKPFQIDLLRRDDSVPGVASTRHFSLFVSNSGKGDTATDEYQARGAMVLAHQIRHRELSGAPAPALLSFAERSDRFPFGAFGVLG
ncbi:hypothetical protein ACNOYE_21850 [Nannocystaceae bacterium ST9]